MLRCPFCKKEELVILEFDDIEIDYCLTCRGIWLDSGEMELMVKDPDKVKEIFAAFEPINAKSVGEQERPCPICRKKMEKVIIHSGEDQVVDRCRNGHGIWFDHGELHAILADAKREETSEIVSFLKDILRKDLQE